MADGWVTRENLPLEKGQQLETIANTLYAFLIINKGEKFILSKEELAAD